MRMKNKHAAVLRLDPVTPLTNFQLRPWCWRRVFQLVVYLNHLTWLSAYKDFTECSCHENFWA